MKKTIKVEDFIRLGNQHIVKSKTREQREAVALFMTDILLKNDSYAGFLYADKEGNNTRYIKGVTDETLIHYLYPKK